MHYAVVKSQYLGGVHRTTTHSTVERWSTREKAEKHAAALAATGDYHSVDEVPDFVIRDDEPPVALPTWSAYAFEHNGESKINREGQSALRLWPDASGGRMAEKYYGWDGYSTISAEDALAVAIEARKAWYQQKTAELCA